MMVRCTIRIITVATCLWLMGCSPKLRADLAIIHADVFEANTGKVQHDHAIFIKEGKIIAVEKGVPKVTAAKTIDAKGKLVTPGFIDTHVHPTDVFGDGDMAQEFLSADNRLRNRKLFSSQYLPFGVTTVLSMGQPEKWLPELLQWEQHPQQEEVDLFIAGGALISVEARKPYIGHTTVNSPEAARQQVLAYHAMGLRYLKLYWRLRRPEFTMALHTADSLGMRSFGHIDQNIMFMDSTLDMGLRNYEHILTMDLNVLHLQDDGAELSTRIQEHYGPSARNFPLVRLEMLRLVYEKKKSSLEALVDKLARDHATLSTAIHLMGEPFGLTSFVNTQDSSLTEVHKARGRENFKLLMDLARSMADRGVSLRIGTDCAQGGRAMVSEQLLLAAYGFTPAEVLQISTINGARAMGLAQQLGSIEKNKKAHMIIWDESPLADSRNFSAARTVIKDGVIIQ